MLNYSCLMRDLKLRLHYRFSNTQPVSPPLVIGSFSDTELIPRVLLFQFYHDYQFGVEKWNSALFIFVCNAKQGGCCFVYQPQSMKLKGFMT